MPLRHLCDCRVCQKHHQSRRKSEKKRFIEARLDGWCGCCKKVQTMNRTCDPCRARQDARITALREAHRAKLARRRELRRLSRLAEATPDRRIKNSCFLDTENKPARRSSR